MDDFEIISWIKKKIFSPLLHHFSPQLFPAHHVGNLPSHRSHLSAGFPRSAWWSQLECFKSSPEIMGLGETISHPEWVAWDLFFLTIFFTKKKTQKNGDFRYFLRERLRQHIHTFLGPVFFLFGQSNLSCKVDTVRGKDYWWRSSQFTEALYCKVMDQAFCDCKHQQAWTLLLVAQQTSWAGCLPRL